MDQRATRVLLEQGVDFIFRDGALELTNAVGLERLYREASAGNDVIVERHGVLVFNCPPLSSSG